MLAICPCPLLCRTPSQTLGRAVGRAPGATAAPLQHPSSACVLTMVSFLCPCVAGGVAIPPLAALLCPSFVPVCVCVALGRPERLHGPCPAHCSLTLSSPERPQAASCGPLPLSLTLRPEWPGVALSGPNPRALSCSVCRARLAAHTKCMQELLRCCAGSS